MQQHNQTPEYWIKKLGLVPHPEGGFYRETYRSSDSIPRSALPAGFNGERSVSTSIYYLLQGLQVSRLHRIQSDEIWHHYAGDDLKLISVDPGGLLSIRIAGKEDPESAPQILIPGKHWFGGYCVNPEGYTLVGCTVAPGFDFADFEMYSAGSPLPEIENHRSRLERLI